MENKFLGAENEIQRIYSDLGLIVPVGDLETGKAPAIQPLPTSSTQTTVTAKFNVMSGGEITALSYKVNDGAAVSLTPAKGVVTITLSDLEYNSGPYEIEITATNATGSTSTSSTIALQHYTNWATPDEVLAGNRYIGEDSEAHVGEIVTKTATNVTFNDGNVNVPVGYYAEQVTKAYPVVLETVPVTPTTSAQTITPSTGYDGIGTANVSAVTSDIDANILSNNIKNGVTILGVTGSYAGEASGTIEITSNGTGIDVSTYAYADVAVAVVPNYEMDPADYFSMTAINDNTEIEFSKKNDDAVAPYTLYYSTDNGTTYTEYVDQTITLNQGEKVIWYGNNLNGLSASQTVSAYNSFYITDDVQFSGNIMSLISTDIRYNTIVPFKGFAGLFSNCEYITTAPALPATNIGVRAYQAMFSGCIALTTAPALPATILADSCYSGMFMGCSALTTAPALPATTLGESSYQAMFSGCTALTTAPALPATTLAQSCYSSMFYGCTALASAPALPATTLALGCYQQMFQNCTALASAPALPATTLAQGCYQQMFQGCTSLTSAPSELPATSLAASCYKQMFSGCTSLTASPEMKFTTATTATTFALAQMFQNCTSLNTITINTTSWATGIATNWVQNVASSGDFYNNGEATISTGTNGVPTNWAIHIPA